eukprot:TRINITY_DN47831_c0_g1_i1.p1 TRINITY_DN47831_c0_g1~~TRINITY_DN47831_c0_g1_i1.p1  ORF type:complete len:724 (+),score=94.89 TRINITY_DN47831_c0_g1_i1:35-2206(+)
MPTPVQSTCQGGQQERRKSVATKEPELSAHSYESFLKAELHKLSKKLVAHHAADLIRQTQDFMDHLTNEEKFADEVMNQKAGAMDRDGEISDLRDLEQGVVPANLVDRWASMAWNLSEKSAAKSEPSSEQEESSLQLYDSWRNMRPQKGFKFKPGTPTSKSNQWLFADLGAPNSLQDNMHPFFKEGYYRAGTNLVDFSSFLQNIVLHPHNRARLPWSLLGLAAIAWDIIFLPFDFSVSVGDDFAAILSFVGRISLCYWILDMILHFITGIEVEVGVEMRPVKIISAYMKSWFIPDLLINVMDALVYLIQSFGGTWSLALAKSARFLRVLRLLRLTRLLRVSKLQKLLDVVTRTITSDYFWLVLKIVYWLMLMVIANHYMAIAWMVLGLHGMKHDLGQNNNWLQKVDLQDAKIAELYVTSLHWTLTQFAPATNNVAPTNAMERVFAIAVVLTAMGVFSSFLSSITSTVNDFRLLCSKKKTQEALVRRFFHQRKISGELLKSLTKAYQQYSLAADRLRESDVKILSEIPEIFRIKLHREMFQPILETLCCLPAAVLHSNSNFIIKVCHFAVSEQAALPQHTAFLADDVIQGPVAVTSGCMSYESAALHHEGGSVIPSLKEWLCEAALFAHWQCRGQLLAVGTCHFATINSKQFADLASNDSAPLFSYLRVYSMLLVTLIEDLMTDGSTTDLPLPPEISDRLKERAHNFCTQRPSNAVKLKMGISE